jgi:hypothetical protein
MPQLKTSDDKARLEAAKKALKEQTRLLKKELLAVKDTTEHTRAEKSYQHLTSAQEKFAADFDVKSNTPSKNNAAILKFEKACDKEVSGAKNFSTGIKKCFKGIATAVKELCASARRAVANVFKSVGGLFKKSSAKVHDYHAMPETPRRRVSFVK